MQQLLILLLSAPSCTVLYTKRLRSQENTDMYGSATLGVFITVIYFTYGRTFTSHCKECCDIGHSNIVPCSFSGV
jgi:hypothetical protein